MNRKHKKFTTAAMLVAVSTGYAVQMTSVDVHAAEVSEADVNAAAAEYNEAKATNDEATAAVEPAQSEYDAKVAEKENVEKIAAEATPEKITETETAINDKTAEKATNDALVEEAKKVEETAKNLETEKQNISTTATTEKLNAENALNEEKANLEKAKSDAELATDAKATTSSAETEAKANLDTANATEREKAAELETAKQNEKDLATAIKEQESAVENAKQTADDATKSVEDSTKASEDAKASLADAENKKAEIEAKTGSAPEIKFTNPDAVKAYIQGYHFDWYKDVNSPENRAYMDSESAQAAREDIKNAFKAARYIPTEKDKTTILDAWNLTDDQINELTLFGNSIINSMNKQFGYNPVRTSDALAKATRWMQNEYKKRFVDGTESYTFSHIGIEKDFTKQSDEYMLSGETLCAGPATSSIGLNYYGMRSDDKTAYAMADFKFAIYESIREYMTNEDELAHAQLTTEPNTKNGVGVWTVIPGARTNMKLSVVQFNYAYTKDRQSIEGSYVDNKDKYADELNTANANIEKYTAEVAETSEALETAKAALIAAKANLTTETEKLNALKNGESPLVLAQRAYDAAKNALSEAENAYDNAVAAHDRATEAKDLAEQKVAEITQKVAEAEKVFNIAAQKAENAESELRVATEARVAAQNDAAMKIEKSAVLEKELAELNNKLDIYKNAPQKLTELEDEIMILAEKLEKAKTDKTMSDEELAMAKEKYEGLKAEYDKQVADAKAKADAEAKVNAAMAKKNNAPKTGDSSNVALATTAGILSMAGIFSLNRRKQNSDR